MEDRITCRLPLWSFTTFTLIQDDKFFLIHCMKNEGMGGT